MSMPSILLLLFSFVALVSYAQVVRLAALDDSGATKKCLEAAFLNLNKTSRTQFLPYILDTKKSIDLAKNYTTWLLQEERVVGIVGPW